MSKSKGNFTDPLKIIEKFGADALRFYLLSSPIMDAENINFKDSSVEEIYKKVIVILYNVANFYELYKNLPESKTPSKNAMDIWIISRTNNLVKEVTKYLQDYNTIRACGEIRIFVDDLSTWYVRNSRDR